MNSDHGYDYDCATLNYDEKGWEGAERTSNNPSRGFGGGGRTRCKEIDAFLLNCHAQEGGGPVLESVVRGVFRRLFVSFFLSFLWVHCEITWLWLWLMFASVGFPLFHFVLFFFIMMPVRLMDRSATRVSEGFPASLHFLSLSFFLFSFLPNKELANVRSRQRQGLSFLRVSELRGGY